MRLRLQTPLLLYSYLASEMLGPFLASFLIMNCVFLLAKLIPFLNFVLELNIGLSDFIRLLCYLFPKIFLYTLPMAALLGVTIGIARLSNDSEILAFKASGISMYQILPPVLIVTTLIGLLTSYVSIQLIPKSAEAMRLLSYQLLKEKISHGIKEHVFTEALGDVVVYVEKIDKSTGKWSDVWVSDMRGNDTPIVTMASSGEMTSSLQDMSVSIILHNGSLHKSGNESAQIVQFDRYKIIIPLTLPTNKATSKKRSSFTMGELLQHAAHQDKDSKAARMYLMEFHQRLVLPVGCLMISLLGLPLGLQARPGKKALGLQIGFAIFIFYYIIFTFGKDLAEKGILPIWFAMWTPNFLFSVLAVVWIYRVASERPLMPEKLFSISKNFLFRITSPAITLYRKIIILAQKRSAKIILRETENSDSLTTNVIRGDAKNRLFHISACKDFNCPHCTLEFKDISVAIEAGFVPCRICENLIGEQGER